MMGPGMENLGYLLNAGPYLRKCQAAAIPWSSTALDIVTGINKSNHGQTLPRDYYPPVEVSSAFISYLPMQVSKVLGIPQSGALSFGEQSLGED